VLVQIVISQRASLQNEVRAADALFAVYPGLSDLALAPEDAIAQLIRPAGLYRIKAKSISAIARHIRATEVETFEHHLSMMGDAEARATLLSLPGVGAKTADCMLELGLERLRLPVDTNIRKLGIRLALIRGGNQDDRLRDILVAAIHRDIESFIEAHSILLAVGQNLCRSSGTRRLNCLLCAFIETRYASGGCREVPQVATPRTAI
jgi:endonuclease III